MGFTQFKASPTVSTPTSFNSTTYNGLGIGINGYFPWNEIESKWGFGAELWYHLFPNLSETPVNSGTPENTQMLELAGQLYYHLQPNIYLISKLSMNSSSTHFTGSGTRLEPASYNEVSWTKFNAGFEYLF